MHLTLDLGLGDQVISVTCQYTSLCSLVKGASHSNHYNMQECTITRLQATACNTNHKLIMIFITTGTAHVCT